KLVTGVQTCALPISDGRQHLQHIAQPLGADAQAMAALLLHIGELVAVADQLLVPACDLSFTERANWLILLADRTCIGPRGPRTRSEERRVGKGGKSR